MEKTIALLFLCTAVEAFGGKHIFVKAKKKWSKVLDQHVGEVSGNGEWNENEEEQSSPFYCINITVVVEKKSWEEALQHCRENNADLSSLHSDTENIAAGKDQNGVRTTELVWIGLRFLGHRWLWVNGDPLEYEAWPEGGIQDHQCPIQNRCGALNREGLWVNRDCEERLNFVCS